MSGEVLHLSHHVIGRRYPTRPACSGGRSGNSGDSKRLENRLEGRKVSPLLPVTPPSVMASRSREPAVVTGAPGGSHDGPTGLRPMNEYRPHRSPPSTDSSRKLL